MKRVKKLVAGSLIFLPTLCMGEGYIESITVDGATTNAIAKLDGEYNISYSHGLAGYEYHIFQVSCQANRRIRYGYSYIALPLKVNINNKAIDVEWSTSSEYFVEGDRLIIYSPKSENLGVCHPLGEKGRSSPAAALLVTGRVNISDLLSPGVVALPDILYYVGNVFGDSKSEALSILKQHYKTGDSIPLKPNGNGILVVPYQCKSEDISVSMGKIPLGKKESKLVNYSIECNSEYASLKAMGFKLYGGSQEIFSSPNRQMIKIKMDNGSVGEVNITPQLSGKNVNLLMNVTLDASLGKEGNAKGSVILRYTFD